MKIIFSTFDSIGNSFYNGGGARAVHEIAKRLKRTHDIEVVTSKYPGFKNGKIDGVEYSYTGPLLNNPKISQIAYQLLLPVTCARKSFDVWFENFTPPYATAFLPLVTSKPVVGITHFFNAEEKSKEYHLPFTPIQNLGIQTYKHVIALTDEVKEKVEKLNRQLTSFVISNGSNIEQAKNVNDHPGNYFLSIGRIEIGQKGLDLLLQAFSLASTSISDMLYIAGTGQKSDESQLKKLIESYHLSDRVKLLGRVEGTLKESLMRNAKAILISSRFEGQSLASMETVALATPIISFDIPGLAWVSSECSLKAPLFDIQKFSSHVISLSQNSELRRTLSQACLKLANHFSWDLVAQEYERVITEVTTLRHEYSSDKLLLKSE